MDFALFLESAVNGALVGLMYALVAIGIVLIYKSSSVPNLAQGAMVMLGAYIVLAFAGLGLPLWAAIPLGIVTSKGILREVFGPESAPPDFATRGGGLLGLRPGAFLAGSADVQALAGHMPRIEGRYGELRMPVHVLFGRGDRLLDWRANGQALVDKLPDGRLQLVEGGHMLPVTQPELTASFIEGVVAARPALAR